LLSSTAVAKQHCATFHQIDAKFEFLRCKKNAPHDYVIRAVDSCGWYYGNISRQITLAKRLL